MRAGLRLRLVMLAAGLALGQASALAQSTNAATTNTPTPDTSDRASFRISAFPERSPGRPTKLRRRLRRALLPHRPGVPFRRRRPSPARCAARSRGRGRSQPVSRWFPLPRLGFRSRRRRPRRSRSPPPTGRPRPNRQGRGSPRRSPKRPFRRRGAEIRRCSSGYCLRASSAAALRCCCGAAARVPHSRTGPNSTIFRRPNRRPRLHLRRRSRRAFR